LRRCTLQGIYATELDLLRFFGDLQLVHVTLEDIHLQEGEFKPVFDLLTHMHELEYLHLDDLFQGKLQRLLHFDVPGQPKFPSLDKTIGPNTLTRIGTTQMRESIICRYSPVRGSPQKAYNDWRDRRTLLYGVKSELSTSMGTADLPWSQHGRV